MATATNSKSEARRRADQAKRQKIHLIKTRRIALIIIFAVIVMTITPLLLLAPLNETKIFGFPTGYFLTTNAIFLGCVTAIFWGTTRKKSLDDNFLNSEDY